jgi:hypothetical protein
MKVLGGQLEQGQRWLPRLSAVLDQVGRPARGGQAWAPMRPRRPNEIHVDLSGGLASALTLEQIRALLEMGA